MNWEYKVRYQKGGLGTLGRRVLHSESVQVMGIASCFRRQYIDPAQTLFTAETKSASHERESLRSRGPGQLQRRFSFGSTSDHVENVEV